VQDNNDGTKKGFLGETLLKKGFSQTLFRKLFISYCSLISGDLYGMEKEKVII